jgi:hypothetical protein
MCARIRSDQGYVPDFGRDFYDAVRNRRFGCPVDKGSQRQRREWRAEGPIGRSMDTSTFPQFAQLK